jgi:transglutaminase-like putative cysteine protease
MPREDEAVTGLGDEMNPGAIAHLSESDEPALRVRFAGELPPPRERYWRGPVLHDFDGQAWHRRRGGAAEEPLLDYGGRSYHYTVTLEPNTHGTVLALELVQPPDSPDVSFTRDFQLLARRPISTAQEYELTSYPQARALHVPGEIERQIDLDLPRGLDPRARELARQLRAAAANDAAYAESVLDYLRHGGYEYKLNPQRLGRDAVDDLLFGTREGFCGHYASAYAFLMRAGGVPARVVTGYQGGEWNPVGRYLVVRQSDAHAWTEAWLDGRGWTRIDPTAVVSPGRIERELLQFGAALDLRGAGLFGSHRWLAGLLQAWDAAGAWWQDDVVGFNYARQLRLAEHLGFGDRGWQTLAIALGAGMGAWLAWIGWSLGRATRSRRPDLLARAWQRIDARLARAGLPRAATEGVRAYCERLAASDAAMGARLAPLAEQYLQLRYGRPGDDGAAHERELRAFLAAARRWRHLRKSTRG